MGAGHAGHLEATYDTMRCTLPRYIIVYKHKASSVGHYRRERYYGTRAKWLSRRRNGHRVISNNTQHAGRGRGVTHLRAAEEECKTGRGTNYRRKALSCNLPQSSRTTTTDSRYSRSREIQHGQDSGSASHSKSSRIIWHSANRPLPYSEQNEVLRIKELCSMTHPVRTHGSC